MKKPIIILVGPSGVGKSTFLDQILKDFPSICDIITYTTRTMRKGETQGFPYHFVTKEEFNQKIKEGYFVEWAKVHDNLYGTPKDSIEQAWKDGKAVIMDLDVQGAQVFQREYSQTLTIFIHPPSIDALRERVLKRDGDKIKDLELRMENALKEISLSHLFSHQLININYDNAYKEIKKMIEDYL